MSLEIKTFCPLGAKCEEARDGAIHRCAWYAQVRGFDKNTGGEIDEWRCSMTWIPALLIENSSMQLKTGVAIESFRNEMVQANDTQHKILLAKINIDQKLIEG